ncbi:MAG: 1,4-alpha-glucan branching protein GlgB, partial [Candidatus Eisenbacteria bacterium]
TADDVLLFEEGKHYRLWEKLGSHPVTIDGVPGTYFALWAPNAEKVSVLGEWNDWAPGATPLRPHGSSGIWEGFVPGIARGALYKYHLRSRYQEHEAEKADPFALLHEAPPQTASVVWDLDYLWNDRRWMEERRARQAATAPMSIYEVHLGSWRRVPENGRRSLRYRELAPGLASYARSLGVTHVEMMPVMEHPFYGSWGYQTTGYFAPTARQGKPQDFMHLVDSLHENGIGVILDWVPSHFPDDPHGLAFFDGTYLFEHADPRKGFHPDWHSLIYNYGRPEVRSFLISSALFWLEKYHADGLRVDAVASMLYLDYSRKDGEWIPNEYGGRENLQAIKFLRQLNEAVHEAFPEVVVIAEESTSWPMVSRPIHLGGLGFDMKWDMGWMHDTLRYLARSSVYRRFHHNEMTFRMLYAFQEHFVLALSHDEVVHGKRSLADKMPGDAWQKFANQRLLFAYMVAMPGRKHFFMGMEFGQWREWNHDDQLQWELLPEPLHAGLKLWIEDLNRLYQSCPALYELDQAEEGFAWIDCNDSEQSVLTLLRQGAPGRPFVAITLNFTPIGRLDYRLGVPVGGTWTEALNSDGKEYGGSGMGNYGGVTAEAVEFHGRPFSLSISLPPLGAVIFVGPPRPEPVDDLRESTEPVAIDTPATDLATETPAAPK